MDATALREHPNTAGAEQAVDTEKSVVVDAVDLEGDDGIRFRILSCLQSSRSCETCDV